MEAITDEYTREVVWWASGQVGKTEVINNAVGYYIEHEPAPMLVIQPTLELAKTWSKDRLTPMLQESPCFKGLIKDPRSRDSGNTLLHKGFPGGHVTMAGSNSAASLASRPVRVVLPDEIDSFDESVGSEGDPVKLAEKRAETFWNKKIIKTSTAKKPAGVSRIERDFENGDKRRYWVPCPHCDEHQILKFSQLKWPEGEPEGAWYLCEHCGCALNDADKPKMLAGGEWRAEKKFRGIASFHLNALYSPWLTFAEMAEKFLEAKKSRETLITFINLYLAETFEDQTAKVDEESLIKRKENWGDAAPDEVLVITAGIDVQDNRIELELIGWGAGEESWSLDYQVFMGNPGEKEIWDQLDKYLLTPYPHKSGYEMSISGAAIDTGGHHTQKVYEFCSTRQFRRIFAIKGSNQSSRPLITKPNNNNRLKVPLWTIGVDTGKESVMTRLTIDVPGDGYCHFPSKYEADYFKGLTSEVRVIAYKSGVAKMKWIKKPGQPRNEPLDCRVYGYAAMKILNVNFEKLKAEALRRATPETPPDTPPGGNKPWIPTHNDWLKKKR